MRLGIVVSHPIQYNGPLFRHLAKQLDIVVFYCHNPNETEIGKEGFGLNFKWDIDLLEGYKSVFLKNASSYPSLSNFNGCSTPDIGLHLKKENITHVLIFGWYLRSYCQAFWFCLKNKIPVAVRGDSQLNPDDSKLKSVFKKLLYPLFIKRYTALLYVGERNKEYLIAHGAKKDQLIFSPHAVDQEFWNDEIIIKKKGKGIRFLWVAKFIDKKRPLDVIRAFQLISKIYNDVELVMVGTGPLLEQSKSTAGHTSKIYFAGFKNQSELRPIYKESDCLVLSSDRGETWGLVVNEAFASGIPAIVSNTCGSSADMIDEGWSGYTFEKGSIDDLSKKMAQLMTDLKKDNAHFSKRIKEKNEIYSYSNTCRGIIEFVNKF